MELLSGDEFPDLITPFPGTTPELLYPLNPTQKLKPIRSTGNPTPTHDDTCQTRALTRGYGECSGFVKREPGADFDRVNSYCDGSGRETRDCSEYGSGSKDLTSSSSEEDVDDLKTHDIDSIDKKSDSHLSKKRKKKGRMRRELKLPLENLVMQVMDRQERLYKQLIEMIEKREKERLVQEQAWQKQEMERMKKNEELRQQELSRSRAIISLIEDVLGHEIPQPLIAHCRGGDDGNEQTKKDYACDTNSEKWPDTEVQVLITLRTAMEPKFQTDGLKCLIWEEISSQMLKLGYKRSGKKCKEKWENICKYFRRTFLNRKKYPANSKSSQNYQFLDTLYKNGSISLGRALESAKCERES